MADEESSLRDVIEGEFERAEEADEKPDTPTKDSPSGEAGGDTPKGGPAEADSASKEGEGTSEEEKVRSEATAKPGEKAPEVETKVEDAPKVKAPGTWTPSAREKWDSLHPDVQKEVLKREKDIANGFTEVGKIRQFGQDMHGLWQPFQSLIAAEGGDAMATTRNLFATAASLYGGSPAQKAAVITSLIKSFGVDVGMLDSMLAGETPTGVAAQPQRQQNIQAHIAAEVQKATAPLYQQQQTAVQSEIETFAADPKNEFFDDVKDIMADFLDLAHKRGEKLDLPTAYSRAILAHTDISKVVQERSAKEKAAAVSKTAVAARKKAVSVTGAPAKAASSSNADSSLRDTIADAMNASEA